MQKESYHIFLASSDELSKERKEFGNFIRKLDEIYNNRGVRIHVFEWEDADAADNDRRKQDEYNERVRESDMFIALFYTKAGIHTIEEYNVAISEFSNKRSPKVYVYCKTLGEREKETLELEAFKAEHARDNNDRYWPTFSSQDSLHLHFIQQFLIVESSYLNLSLEGDKVMLEGVFVAELAKLPFAAGNKNYLKMKDELEKLPIEIAMMHQLVVEYPENVDYRKTLEEKQNSYNDLKNEFGRLQKALFDTSQRIAKMQHEQMSEKLSLAKEAFETGHLERASTLLDEIEQDSEVHWENLTRDRMLVHQDIEAFLLRAKTSLTAVDVPVETRIKQVNALYKKAEKWAKESALPPDRLDGLLDDYAGFLYDYGRYGQAYDVYNRLLVLRKVLYGRDHVKTAATYNCMGALFEDQGKYSEALTYHRQALSIRKRVLGPDHIETGRSYNNIGEVFFSLRDYPSALRYYRKSLSVYRKVVGEDHSYTAIAYNNIANVNYRLQKYGLALKYHDKALAIEKKVLGVDHAFTAGTYNNMGAVYKEKAMYSEAIGSCKEALNIWGRVLGTDHPDLAFAYKNIGDVYFRQDDFDQALENYQKAVEVRERRLGFDHPDTASAYLAIGDVAYHCQNYPEALSQYKKAHAIYKKKMGAKHGLTLESKRKIQRTMRAMRKPQ